MAAKRTTAVEIKIKPFSINAAYQGRRFKTKAAKLFEHNVLALLPKQEQLSGWIGASYEFGLMRRTFARSDVANFEKLVSDLLVKRGYIEDDRKIIDIQLRKVLADDYYIKVKLWQIDID